VDQLLVKALVQVAQGMGIKTVAEFVEDEETLELLRAVGVTHAQGYFIGRPAPAAALSAEPADAADRGAS